MLAWQGCLVSFECIDKIARYWSSKQALVGDDSVLRTTGVNLSLSGASFAQSTVCTEQSSYVYLQGKVNSH